MLKIKLSEKSKELIKRIKGIEGKTWLQIMQTVVNQITWYIIGEVQDNLTGKVLNVGTGGALRNSIKKDSTQENDGKTFLSRIGNNLIYARIHEYGGVIKAKKAKALRFQIGGKWVMVKSVTMPERSYLRTAVNDNKDNILKIFEFEFMRGLKEALA